MNIALLVDKDVTGKIILAIFNTNKESDVFLHGSDVLHVRLITHHSTYFSSVSLPFWIITGKCIKLHKFSSHFTIMSSAACSHSLSHDVVVTLLEAPL